MLTIVTGEETEILRKKALKVKDPTATSIRELIPEMVETMRAADGVGLAAPQIGLSIRMCVIEVGGKISVFFNPKITASSREKVVFEEGCLSLPGTFFPIKRSEGITVRYDDENGKPKKLKARGFLAIVIQHEIDHLEGTLIVDRYRKQIKKHAYAL
jgi:peptide deformylase